jgi:AmmeMemoRadiSam system protein A
MSVIEHAHMGTLLLGRARSAVEARLGLASLPPATDARLEKRGATFVTLRKDGDLRGCIGSLNAHRPLGRDIEANAVAAAFDDPRFPPVTAAEWPQIAIEASLLSEPEFMEFSDEADALSRLRPGVDGVTFFNGCQHATFLPQVWEQLPEPQRFMAALKKKAGKAADFWGPNVMLATYQVVKWKEEA